MCGRFAQRKPSKIVAKTFNVEVPELQPRFNIAPTQDILAVREGQDAREAVRLRWGFIPSWARERPAGAGLINARSETVAEKPSFREPFKRQRCLIPADGFFEWQRLGGKKQPHFFRMSDDALFAFAGLWDSWRDEKGDVVESCVILTTTPNELLSTVHDRMPVILAPQDYDLWLDKGVTKPEHLSPLLRPCRAERMRSHSVSLLVNDVLNDEASCIEPENH
jgi:putative SOS response-associated peptidase YedK